MPPTPMLRQPEDCRAPSPFCLCVSVWAACDVNERIILFQTFVKAKWCSLFYCAFCFSFFLSKFELGKFDFREPPAGLEAREKCRILVEA
jgi:hypothetical protein